MQIVQARKLIGLLTVCLCIYLPAATAMEIGGTAIDPGTRVDLRLVIPPGADDPGTFIPVSVLRGAKPGPTLLIVAGVHGFEFISLLTAERLADDIDPTALAGTLILVRAANVPAFEERSPYVNPFDRKNLNRSFPGKADGTQSERIAHALATELITRADFVVDAHSGDGAEWLESFVGVYGGPLATGYSQALGFAEALGVPRLVRYQMRRQEQIDRARSLNRQAVAQGVATVLLEVGENGRRDDALVTMAVNGLKSGMSFLGMLTGEEIKRTDLQYFEGETSVPVAHSGLWHPAMAEGRLIEEGEVLGQIRDYAGRLVETVLAPTAGYALYGLAGPPVRAGDSVVAITRPVATLK